MVSETLLVNLRKAFEATYAKLSTSEFAPAELRFSFGRHGNVHVSLMEDGGDFNASQLVTFDKHVNST